MSRAQRRLTDFPTRSPENADPENDCGHMDEYRTADGDRLRCTETDYVGERIAETQALADDTHGGMR